MNVRNVGEIFSTLRRSALVARHVNNLLWFEYTFVGLNKYLFIGVAENRQNQTQATTPVRAGVRPTRGYDSTY